MLSENPEPDTSTEGISTTQADEVQDIGNVVNINKDKLSQVDNKAITDACEEMQDIKGEREELNARAGEIRSRLKNLGIPPAAFNAAIARYELGEEKRAKNDAAFAKCCNAMDVGYQSDLFQ